VIALLQTLVWPVFLALLLFLGRKPLARIAAAVERRIERGAEVGVKAFGTEVTIGKLLPDEAQLQRAQIAARKPTAPEGDILNSLYLIHARTGPPHGDSKGRERWWIHIRLDADSPDLLDSVDRVVYHLHPTFHPPEREITQRENGFELTIGAWGEFNVWADVYLKDKRKPLVLRRYLNF